MSEITDPKLLGRDPNVIVYSLLMSDWDDTTISGRFETAWLHTGWYDDTNPNPQVSITPRNDGPTGASQTGYTGIDASGRGPTAQMDGQIDVNVWVPHDEQHPSTGEYEVTGVNPKKLAWELRCEVVRIIGRHATGTTYNGERELQSLGTGTITTPPEPEGTDIENRYFIPVLYSWHQGREAPEDDGSGDGSGD